MYTLHNYNRKRLLFFYIKVIEVNMLLTYCATNNGGYEEEFSRENRNRQRDETYQTHTFTLT